MTLALRDTAPTTAGEKAMLRQMPTADRVVWCPLREQQIDLVVCARLQADNRKQCGSANRGHGCQHLDSCAAERLQRVRKEALQ